MALSLHLPEAPAPTDARTAARRGAELRPRGLETCAATPAIRYEFQSVLGAVRAPCAGAPLWDVLDLL
eukprot:1289176-Pyramimonas_sp.AAC.1